MQKQLSDRICYRLHPTAKAQLTEILSTYNISMSYFHRGLINCVLRDFGLVVDLLNRENGGAEC